MSGGAFIICLAPLFVVCALTIKWAALPTQRINCRVCGQRLKGWGASDVMRKHQDHMRHVHHAGAWGPDDRPSTNGDRRAA